MTPLFRLANGGCRSLRPEHRELGHPGFLRASLRPPPHLYFAMNEARYASSTSDKQVESLLLIKLRHQIPLAKTHFSNIRRKSEGAWNFIQKREYSFTFLLHLL